MKFGAPRVRLNHNGCSSNGGALDTSRSINVRDQVSKRSSSSSVIWPIA